MGKITIDVWMGANMMIGGSRSTDEVAFLKKKLSGSGECDKKAMKRLCLFLVEPHEDPEVPKAAARALEELARIDEVCDPEALTYLERCLEAQRRRKLKNEDVVNQVEMAIEAIKFRLAENND